MLRWLSPDGAMRKNLVLTCRAEAFFLFMSNRRRDLCALDLAPKTAMFAVMASGSVFVNACCRSSPRIKTGVFRSSSGLIFGTSCWHGLLIARRAGRPSRACAAEGTASPWRVSSDELLKVAVMKGLGFGLVGSCMKVCGCARFAARRRCRCSGQRQTQLPITAPSSRAWSGLLAICGSGPMP